MQRRILLTLCGALIAATSAAAATRTAQVDQVMRAYQGRVPGASLCVIRGGRVLLERSYGLADLEQGLPVSASTDFRLASMTKQFTAAAVLLLVQDGRLSLEDPIGRWLPSLPPAPAAATIRQLLTHSGGLVDYEDLIPPDAREQLHDADVLRLLSRENRTYFPPGTAYRYSDSGYSLLSLIVARAAGQDFASFLRQRIFLPLGMHDTLAYESGISLVPNRAYGYSWQAGAWVRTDQSLTSAVLGDGGIYSSARDLQRWDAALYGGGPLSEASLRLAFTPAVATDDPNVQYGFGWRITGQSLWHSGETLGFRNVIVRWPRQRFTVLILTNRDDPELYSAALAIARIYVPGIDLTRASAVVVGPDSGAKPLPPPQTR
jgi:CubicO group peptidase (beta-lactamase class C family)